MTNKETELTAPRLFVSYSWSNPDHEAWTLDLALQLRTSGVDVILDKWDLKEGHDANAFMEQMVTDATIKKVILVCDRVYAAKTNERTGGVGAEAQIISSELYAKQAQDKFAAIVVERDEEGQPFLPAYYQGRIYIDLSDPGTYSENFDRLLRWIFDRPLHEKPEIGPVPSFLTQDGTVTTLATTARFRRAIDAIQQGRHNAIPATSEYLTNLAQQFEKLRLDPKSDPFDEAVVQSTNDFLPHRNEAIDLFLTLALYSKTTEAPQVLHKFFEQILPYTERPEHVSTWREFDFDNYRFIVHELYLYAVAALIHHDRFESAAHLIGTEYYSPRQAAYGQSMVGFDAFDRYVRSLDDCRNKRLQSRRMSVHADMLRNRCNGVGLHFQDILQADFILFIRSCIKDLRWWPRTLLFTSDPSAPFEIFARSKSAAYFSKARVLLGIDSKNELDSLIQEFQTGQKNLPSWQYYRLAVTTLLGSDQIATVP